MNTLFVSDYFAWFDMVGFYLILLVLVFVLFVGGCFVFVILIYCIWYCIAMILCCVAVGLDV